jgi:O-antigen/teichoic acid export membrane protein
MRRLTSFLAIASAVWSRVAVFVVLGVAARLLEADEFGLYALAQLAVGVIAAIVSSGDMWLNRFTRRGSGGATLHLAQAIYVVLGAGTAALVVAVGAVAAALPWGTPHYRQTLLVAAILGAVSGCGELIFALIRSRQRVVEFFLLRDLLVPLAVVVLLLAVRPRTAPGVLALAAVVWLAAIAWALLREVPALALRQLAAPAARRLRRHLLPVALRHTLMLQASNLLARLAYLDVFVLSTVIPIVYIGNFRVAAQLAMGFVVVQHFLFLSLPWQLRAARHGGADEVASHHRLLLGLAALAFVALMLGAPWILGLFGERFRESAWVLQALLAIRFAGLLWGPQHELLVSNGYVMGDALTNLALVAVWVPVFLLAWSVADPLRAAIVATAVADAGVQLLRWRLLRKAGVPPAWLPHAGPLAGAAIGGATAVAVLAAG